MAITHSTKSAMYILSNMCEQTMSNHRISVNLLYEYDRSSFKRLYMMLVDILYGFWDGSNLVGVKKKKFIDDQSALFLYKLSTQFICF